MATRKSKKRVDQLLFARGMVESLEKARALVMAGQVMIDDQRIEKPSQLVEIEAAVRIKGRLGRFVSRGGEKLAGAIMDFHLEETIKGIVALDIGSSTGGFTHCLLEFGARKVYALDVGTNQLAWSIRQDPRVVTLEKTDIREFDRSRYDAIDMVVADISFNSISVLLPSIIAAAPAKGVHFLVLIKPQFELPRGLVPEGGVVDDEISRARALEAVRDAFTLHGFSNGRAIDSRLPGRGGNKEIFFHVIAQ